MESIYRLTYRQKRSFSFSLTLFTAIGAVLTVAGPVLFPCPVVDKNMMLMNNDGVEKMNVDQRNNAGKSNTVDETTIRRTVQVEKVPLRVNKETATSVVENKI